MKTFKKIVAIALIAVLLVCCLASCGTKKAASLTVEEGKLTMATNASFPPYEFYEGEEIVGIDAEIAGLIADKLGLELQIMDVEFDSIIPGVQSGKYDIGMAGMTVTDERLQKINFTDSYAKGVQSVILPKDTTIKSLDDIKGKKVGAQAATTGAIYAEGDYGAENLTTYPTGNQAVEALKAGKVDCVITDNQPAKAYVAANPDAGLTILDTTYVEEDYAICTNKNNEELLTKVNEALKELIADGSVQKIIDKYIAAE